MAGRVVDMCKLYGLAPLTVEWRNRRWYQAECWYDYGRQAWIGRRRGIDNPATGCRWAFVVLDCEHPADMKARGVCYACRNAGEVAERRAIPGRWAEVSRGES